MDKSISEWQGSLTQNRPEFNLYFEYIRGVPKPWLGLFIGYYDRGGIVQLNRFLNGGAP